MMARPVAALCVFAGGAAGTAARLWAGGLPSDSLALLVVNALGTLVLAAVTSALITSTGHGAEALLLFAGTGLCGSLTTQSGLALTAVTAGWTAGLALTLVHLLVGAACAGAGWVLGAAARGPGR